MEANVLKRKISLRAKRKKSIRSKISGTNECPRVSIFKSNRTVYVQAIDDIKAVTIASCSGKKLAIKANIEGAKTLAKEFAGELKKAKISKVVFDRNGYLYHGVVAAFGDSLRENGIEL